jgi:hypothetical protein
VSVIQCQGVKITCNAPHCTNVTLNIGMKDDHGRSDASRPAHEEDGESDIGYQELAGLMSLLETHVESMSKHMTHLNDNVPMQVELATRWEQQARVSQEHERIWNSDQQQHQQQHDRRDGKDGIRRVAAGKT